MSALSGRAEYQIPLATPGAIGGAANARSFVARSVIQSVSRSLSPSRGLSKYFHDKAAKRIVAEVLHTATIHDASASGILKVHWEVN
jgi:hypothetical protein